MLCECEFILISTYIGVTIMLALGVLGCKLQLRQAALSVYESSWSSGQTAS